jgi:hypothetical protein
MHPVTLILAILVGVYLAHVLIVVEHGLMLTTLRWFRQRKLRQALPRVFEDLEAGLNKTLVDGTAEVEAMDLPNPEKDALLEGLHRMVGEARLRAIARLKAEAGLPDRT